MYPDKPRWLVYLPMLIIFVGLVGGWFTNKASVAALVDSGVKLDGRMEVLHQKSHALELRMARDSEVLERTQHDIQEVKRDIKEIKTLLLRRR